MDPDVARLEDLLRRIRRLSDDHWRVLDPVCTLTEDGAWMGPAADRYTAAVHGRRNRLRTALSRAVDEAEAKLAQARQSAR